jgi:tetratricopeptide (TPR) repeat protein
MINETSLSQCRKNIFAAVSLFLIILITYANTFDASWHFDDENNILNNKPLHLTELNSQNIKRTFFADWNGSGKLYRPVACLSFAFNYYFGGTKVFGYHLVNLIIHFLSSIFLFLFIYHTLHLPLVEARYGSNAYFIALLSAALWAVNPVQTQAVTYVVQRMTSMAGMFFIMAMYFFLKGKTSAAKPSQSVHYILCIVCGILAVGCKENAIMLPVVILLYTLFLFQGVTKKSLKRYSFFLLMALLLCSAIAVVIAGPSILNPKTLIASYQNRGFTLPERVLTEPRVILFYISLLLYPMPDRLSLEHDITLSTGLLTPPSTLVSILAIILMLLLAFIYAKKWPLIAFCVMFFLLNHLIEASVLPLELIFEHRNYVPSMLFFVPFAIMLSKGIQAPSKKRSLQLMLIMFVILVLIGWGHSTFARNKIWKNDGILSFDCIEKYPDLARAHHNLGRFYARNKYYQEAINEYQLALSKENINNLAGKNWTYYNLGSLYQKLGKDDQALICYEQAQKYQPDFAPTHIRKGQLLAKKGYYAKGAQEIQKALDDKTHRPTALANLGSLALQEGKTETAINHFRKALEASPQDPHIMKRLGVAYGMANQSEKALILFKNALSIQPEDPFTLLELARLYENRGMKRKSAETLARFFAFFKGSTEELKNFIDGIKSGSASKPALHSHQRGLLLFLKAACQKRSRKYAALAEGCIQDP